MAILNSAGQYMSSTGTFTSTTPSWRDAFLNSPGSPSFELLVHDTGHPDGTYRVEVRGDRPARVTTPAPGRARVNVTGHRGQRAAGGELAFTCAQNVCTFDGRTSTDENPATLTYSWSFGQGGGGSGPVPSRTYIGTGDVHDLADGA